MSTAVDPSGVVEPSGSTVLKTVIAVVTYRRPAELAIMLPRLIEQSETVQPAASILVIDNDPAGSAEQTVTGLASPIVTYATEATPGIAAARNRALEVAGSNDVLIFIDDDEVPHAGWLSALLSTYRSHRSAGVVGPVISEFESELDGWIELGGFFERARASTGQSVPAAATNNLLLDLAQIRKAGLTFDAAFGLTGGSDHLFTRQLTASGYQITWCDEAVVTDRVPASRMTRRWVLLRAMRYGNSGSRTEIALANGVLAQLRTRLKMIGFGVIRILGGGSRVAVGVVSRSIRERARGSRTVMKGVGYLMGAVGGVYHEYRRIPD